MGTKFQPVPGPKLVIPREQRRPWMLTSTLKDNFKLSTLLLFGALLNGAACLVLPARYALIPVVMVLLHRTLDAVLQCYGLKRNVYMDDVVPGRYTAQIPGRDDMPPTEPSQEDVAVFIVAMRCNHPMGLIAPGYQKVFKYSKDMLTSLYQTPEEHGFLGSTTSQSIGERETTNQITMTMYFRSMEDIHRFAEGPVHMVGRNWWAAILKTHPHLSIMHELYQVPPKHWECYYVNHHLTGMSGMITKMNVDGEMVRPLFSAEKGVFRTSKGRLGEKTGKKNDQYGEAKY